MQANIFDQFDNHPPSRGRIFSVPLDPRTVHKDDLADAREGRAIDASARSADAAVRAANNDAFRIEQERTDPNRALAQIKLDEARANTALASMTAKSNVHGEEYLNRYVPAQQREMVRAYARGDLGSRAGGMSTSMLPIIQHALNYDPTVSATTFPARVKMHSDLAGSQPGTAGGALRGMERMLLHGREVLRAGQRLDNYGPGLLGSIGNTVRTAFERRSDDPKLSAYEELVRNYAPEAQKAIAQTTGGQHEREDRASAYGASSSQASRAAALQGDARQAFDAMASVNDQYKRLMGRDIKDMLSPEAKQAYDELMAGGVDAQGKPLHPVEGYAPIAGNAGGNAPGPGAGGNGGGGGGPKPFDPTSLPSGGEHYDATAATGATRREPVPQADAIVNAALRAGWPVSQTNAELARQGFATIQPDSYANYQGAVDHFRRFPKDTRSASSATREVPTTWAERFAGRPVATAAAHTINGALANIPSAIAGNGGMLDLQAQRNPRSALGGDLVGTALGAAGAEAGAAATLGRLGVQGARLAAWAPRAGDAAFGAVSGGAGNPDDPLSGALSGAAFSTVGGMFGRGATRRAGQALQGVVNPAVQALRNAGVPLTVGQAVGGVLKGIEDLLSGIPVIGDAVRARRIEGFEGFNRAAFDEGLAPIGATTGGITREAGIDAARAERSAAYGRALNGVQVQADGPFVTDMQAALTAGRTLPADMAARAEFALQRAGENFDPNGGLTGDGFQQNVRRFRRATSQNASLPNGDDLGDVLRQGEAAYTGMLNRQAPGVVPAFEAANAANRGVETLRTAVNTARNGTGSGETGLFTPAQLSTAASSSARRFGNTAGTTQQPFFNLTRAGQAVLPSKVPDSGTAGRLALLALPAALGGAGGGVGVASGDAETGGEIGLGLGALLAAGGSRGAQRVLVSALLDRPNALVQFGNQIQRRAALGGMFGAGVPAALAAQP